MEEIPSKVALSLDRDIKAQGTQSGLIRQENVGMTHFGCNGRRLFREQQSKTQEKWMTSL